MNSGRNFIESVAAGRVFGLQSIAAGLLSVAVMGFGASAAHAQVSALSASGYNADLIYEAGQTASSASSFDNVGNTWFQAGSFGYNGTSTSTEKQYNTGLTTGTAFTSAAANTATGGHTSFTIPSAGAGAGLSNNALFLSNTTGTGLGDGVSTGTLTLGTSGLYTSLSIMAASTSDSGKGAGLATGTVTLHFSSGATATTSYNAYDWQQTSTGVSTATNQVFSADVNRSTSATTTATVNTNNTTTNGMKVDTTAGGGQTFNMYETDLNLATIRASDGTVASKDTLTSVTFSVASTSTTSGNLDTTGIFGISAGTGSTMPEPGSDCLVLFGLLGTVAAPLGRRALARRRSASPGVDAG